MTDKNLTYGDISPAVSQWATGGALAQPFGFDVTKAADHVLVMELLSRGYAVAKMPPAELVEELSK